MLLLALSLTATAAPSWANGCVASGDGDQRSLSCPTLTASVFDGAPAPLQPAITAMADGYRTGSEGVLDEVRRRELEVAGAELGMLQVMKDPESEIFVVRGVKKTARGLRLVACTVRARQEADALGLCNAVVPDLLANGIPSDIPTSAPSGSGVEDRIGKVTVPSGCETRGSRDNMDIQCRDGQMVLMAVPSHLSGVELLPDVLDGVAGFAENQGATGITRGMGACAVVGAQTQCAKLSAKMPAGPGIRSAAAAIPGESGEVIVMCSGVGALPKICETYITQAPSF